MTTVIHWTDIEMECGDYRAGFVATFRRYEGQSTDEKDAQGRTVTVTITSFARHIGIAPETFRGWIKKQDHGTRDPAPRDRPQEIMRHTVRTNPEAVVKAVSELPEETQQDIVRQLHVKQLERAGADFSKAGHKARQASTHEHFEPLRQSLNVMQVVPLAEKLADKLRHLPVLTEEERREVDAAVDDVILARTEMHMKAEIES